MENKNDKTKTAENVTAEEAVVSTTAAAKQLGVSVRTIQLWVESGRLVAWKTAGNHRRIFQWSIDQYKEDEGQLLTRRPVQRVRDEEVILIIEDDRTTQVYYETMLQLLEIPGAVKFASDGIEGLVAIGRYLPWLIILDIDMPRLDGVEVVKTLERQNVVEEIALIIISNVPIGDAVLRGMPANCNFLSKPASLDGFRSAIETERSKRHRIRIDSDREENQQ